MINASFEKVQRVEKHPNADKLDILTVSGYTVVSQKDTYQVDDLVFFIREDSQILIDTEKFPWHKGIETYLSKSGRVKTIKLRGIFSSGIIVNAFEVLASYFKIINKTGSIKMNFPQFNKQLEDEKFLEEHFGIKHYVPPALGTSFGALQMAGVIPFGVPKTDEENVQNLSKEDIPFGEEVLVTRKVDGTSCTIIFDNDGKYHVCGRNYEYKLDCDNIYINNTKRIIDYVSLLGYCKKLKENEHLVIQGEIAGKGIQSNKINKISQTEDQKFYVFRCMLWNDKDRTKCDMGNLGSAYHFTSIFDLQDYTVPIIGKAILTQELIDKYINAPAEDGEGVVINHKNGHFKIKSLDYISKF